MEFSPGAPMVGPYGEALYLGRSFDEWLGDLLSSELVNTAASSFWDTLALRRRVD